MVSISSVAANQTGMNSKILTGRVINQKEHFANWDLAAYVLNVCHVPQNDTEKLLFIYIALSDLNKEFATRAFSLTDVWVSICIEYAGV